MYSKNDYRNYLEHRLMKSDDYFAHYGIPGMKWKKRKKEYQDRAMLSADRANYYLETGNYQARNEAVNQYINSAGDPRTARLARTRYIRKKIPWIGKAVSNQSLASGYAVNAGTTNKDSLGDIVDTSTHNALELAQTNSRKRQRGARKKKVSLDGKKIKRRKRA